MSTSFVTVKFSSSNDEVRRISLPTTTTFQQLHEKLKELFNHSFNVSETLIQYFDEEGDLITVTSDEELKEAFRQAKNGVLRMLLKQISSSTQPQLKQSPQHQVNECNTNVPETKEGTKCQQTWTCEENNNEQHPEAVVHAAYCDSCGTIITGIRYKCVNCEDYDLCSTCETKNVHNPTHLFLKIKRPIPYHINQQRRVLLPNMYEQTTASCEQWKCWKQWSGRCPWRNKFCCYKQNGPCHFSRWPLCSFLKKMYDQWQRCCNESQQWNSCSQSNTQCCTPNSTACSNDYCSWGWTCNENTTNNTRTSPNTNKNETKTSQNNDNKQQPQNEQPQLYPNINNDRVKIQDAPDENWQNVYEYQLKKLEEMGFVDRDLNLRALHVTGGSLTLAIQWLLSPQNTHY